MSTRDEVKSIMLTTKSLQDMEDAFVTALDARTLVSNPAGRVAGYTAQSEGKVKTVNEFKQDEERLLWTIDKLMPRSPKAVENTDRVTSGGWISIEIEPIVGDPRWLAIARTHFQEGFSALTRAVFQPQRIRLPEDE